MTNHMLSGLEIVEISAFVAAPLAGLSLAQMGADVIRIDQTGGGPDTARWPLAPDGTSLYWQGLNKAKRSVHLDLRTEKGQKTAIDLIVRAGMVVTNRPDAAWLDYAALSKLRPDLIMVAIRGTHDDKGAVDYTVQARTGLPFITGHARPEAPLNQIFPAWDGTCGLLAALGLMAADRRRRETGEGCLVKLSLEDCALWMIGNLGMIAEAQLCKEQRQPNGNDVFGAFATDFGTSDGRRVMIGVLTNRQWDSLVQATEKTEAIAHLARAFNVDLSTDEGRWNARDAIKVLMAPWFASRPFAEVKNALDRQRVLWGPYQTLHELVHNDPACSTANPLFQLVEQPAGGSYLTPGIPLSFGTREPDRARNAPLQGADTAMVLSQLGATR